MSETTEPTTSTDSDGAIIKAGRHGRARYDAAFLRQVLEICGSSGMSAMAFADHCGFKCSTLAAWVRRARDGGAADSPQVGHGAPRLLVAEVDGAREPGRASGGAVELEVAQGWWHVPSRPRLSLQRRSLLKDRQPLRWDSSAAGHVDAGED